MPTAAVIGAGIVGSASALALQRAGFDVTLYDPMREPSGASWGNAGHIALEQPGPWASWASVGALPRRLFARGGAVDFVPRDWDRWLPFGLRLLAAAPRFARGKEALGALLAEAGGAWERFAARLEVPELYRPIGHFVVWENDAAFAEGSAQWRAADTGTATFRDATADELTTIGSVMRRRPAGAIRFAGTGQIADPTLLAAAMMRAFKGERRYERCRRLPAADIAVVAMGARSADLIPGAPLIAERGYHIQSPVRDWPRELGPLVFEERSLIVTPFVDSVRVASFLEFGRPDSPPDPRKWARLRQHVDALGLPVPEGKPWMGCRPTLPDYLPAIGRGAGNLIYAFGHQHLGLTLGPITGELVAALATGAAPAVPLAPFSLARFG